MNLRLLFAMALAILLGIHPSSAAEPTLTKAQVIKLANAAAKKEGIDLGRYQEPSVSYDPQGKMNNWFLLYQGKPNEHGEYLVGNHFSVTIDDKTQKVEIWPGE